jgi:hypothetical protein
MVNSEEVIKNRNTLLRMLGQVEEVMRTNQRLHDLLSNVMNNPNLVKEINSGIKELYTKVNFLKGNAISLPLIQKEDVLVPTQDDILPEIESVEDETPLALETEDFINNKNNTKANKPGKRLTKKQVEAELKKRKNKS